MKTKTPGSPSQPKVVMTSFTLPEPLWRALKIRAVNERLPLTAICRRAIEAYLETEIA